MTAHMQGADQLRWPGNTPDAIEYGRSLLAAHSFVAHDEAREVHILRLRNGFSRAGFVHVMRYALGVLDLLREVQPLAGGYWITTPPRLVPLDHTALLIAPISTTELQRHFSVNRGGYARWCSSWGDIDLPRQPLRSWMGLEVESTPQWAASVLADCAATMGATIPGAHLEFFAVTRVGKHNRPSWVTDASAALVHNHIALCRSKLSDRSNRYFLGQIHDGRVTHEAKAPSDFLRLQYGVASLLGQGLAVEAQTNSGWVLRVPSPLPRPERRFLFAVARRRGKASEKVYEVGLAEHAALVLGMLGRLGCEVSTNGQ